MGRSLPLCALALLVFLLISGCTEPAGHPTPAGQAPWHERPGTPAPVTEVSLPPAVTTPATIPPVTSAVVVTQTPPPDLKASGSVDKTYYYIVNGNPGFIPLNVYTGVNDYILTFGDIYSGDNYTRIIDNGVQREYVSPLVKKIRDAATGPDDEARIAISLVQHIKYDANSISEVKFNTTRYGEAFVGRYPYTILYQNWGGICGEKSFLLALILKELGYSTALLEFDGIHHMAVGVKAPKEYWYKDTGYALIESTTPEIPTSDEYSLGNAGITMASVRPSKVIPVSSGRSFDSIGQEYADARVEASVYRQYRNVSAAAERVRAALARAKDLEKSMLYWKARVENDLATRDMSTYQNDLLQYNNALAAFNDYLPVYNQRYAEYLALFTEFENTYLPRYRALEAKYGMNTGMNVGL